MDCIKKSNHANDDERWYIPTSYSWPDSPPGTLHRHRFPPSARCLFSFCKWENGNSVTWGHKSDKGRILNPSLTHPRVSPTVHPEYIQTTITMKGGRKVEDHQNLCKWWNSRYLSRMGKGQEKSRQGQQDHMCRKSTESACSPALSPKIHNHMLHCSLQVQTYTG